MQYSVYHIDTDGESCNALFLLARTVVVMTTVISSHVKDKNCIFTGYESCVTGKIIGVYIIKK